MFLDQNNIFPPFTNQKTQHSISSLLPNNRQMHLTYNLNQLTTQLSKKSGDGDLLSEEFLIFSNIRMRLTFSIRLNPNICIYLVHSLKFISTFTGNPLILETVFFTKRTGHLIILSLQFFLYWECSFVYIMFRGLNNLIITHMSSAFCKVNSVFSR